MTGISGLSEPHTAPNGGTNHSDRKAPGVLSTDSQAYGDDCDQLASGSSLALPVTVPSSETRKLSCNIGNCTNVLQKRQFFHSNRAQSPMALESVMSERDSEDEVDDDAADLEDRRMLDEFIDMKEDEKQMMHLWNSFMRKQGVLADNQIPWACEAFLISHGPELVRSPSLFWCWKLFMVKLWNQDLLDGSTMNKCNLTLQQLQKHEHGDDKSESGKTK